MEFCDRGSVWQTLIRWRKENMTGIYFLTGKLKLSRRYRDMISIQKRFPTPKQNCVSGVTYGLMVWMKFKDMDDPWPLMLRPYLKLIGASPKLALMIGMKRRVVRWKSHKIPNPAYKWTMENSRWKALAQFMTNILVCDDPEYANQVVQEVLANREIEKEAFEDRQKKIRKAFERMMSKERKVKGGGEKEDMIDATEIDTEINTAEGMSFEEAFKLSALSLDSDTSTALPPPIGRGNRENKATVLPLGGVEAAFWFLIVV
ncbi:hypothetical protein NC652_040380 [Populus alba x Populus x berolinensis]|nr:hypothetical protein NC652_040380 [Populus alba x Populus x berolinensis]